MIYISGKTDGLQLSTIEAKFQKVENEFHALGLKVINPLKLGISYSRSYDDQMAERKRVINKDVTAMYFLRDWLDSKEAREEWSHANELNALPNRNIIIYLEDKDGMRQVVRDINDKVLTCLIPEP